MSIGKRFKFQGTRFGVETGRSTPKVITAISLGNPAVLSIASHGWAVGDTVYVDAEDGMPELTPGEYVIGPNGFGAGAVPLVGVDSTDYAAFVTASPSANLASRIVFSEFCELTGYNQQDGTSAEIDATTICSTAKEFEVGLPDSGTLSLDYNAAPNTPVQAALRAARKAGAIVAFRLVFPKNGGTVIMFGSVQSTTLAGSSGDLHKATASVKLTGDIVVLV